MLFHYEHIFNCSTVKKDEEKEEEPKLFSCCCTTSSCCKLRPVPLFFPAGNGGIFKHIDDE
jgi:hypothetical protein